MASKKVSERGMETLAIVFSLPYALLMWGSVFCTTQDHHALIDTRISTPLYLHLFHLRSVTFTPDNLQRDTSKMGYVNKHHTHHDVLTSNRLCRPSKIRRIVVLKCDILYTVDIRKDTSMESSKCRYVSISLYTTPNRPLR